MAHRCPRTGPSYLTGISAPHHPLREDSPILPPLAFLPNPPIRSEAEFISPSNIEAGLSAMNGTSFVYPPHYTETIERPRQTWIVCVVQYLLSAMCMLYTMGLYRLYYRKFRFKDVDQSPLGGPFDSNYARWAKIVRRMVGIWRLARIGCGVLLPLAIALLQIDGVINTVFARTCTITTSIFAAAGLLSSGIYLFLRNELINSQNEARWIEASRHSYTLESVEFWTYLALPVASLVWAILTCAVSVMCIAWTNRHSDAEEPESAFIASAVFITSLIAITLLYIYKAAGMLVRY